MWTGLAASNVTAMIEPTYRGRKITILLANVNVQIRYMSSHVHLSVVCLSVTFVHATRAIEIFGNVSSTFGTLATH